MSRPVDAQAAAEVLRARLPASPDVVAVLGSGLGGIVESLVEPVAVPFEDLPGFPPAGVPGHAGRYVMGRIDDAQVLLQGGRYHMYEGHSPEVVAAPVRVAAELGARALVLTNAAGGIRASFEPGDLVLIDDHINAMFSSPLVGPVHPGETRFPDMSEPYDARFRELALAAAAETGVGLERGVYAAVLGPAFETAGEIRMLATMGADLVGMSTVPEVLVARARGLSCLAISVVTNKATGLAAEPPSHQEVLEVGRAAGERLARLMRTLLPRIGASVQSGSTK